MSLESPQIQRVDVVLRQLGHDDFCKSSKKYRGLDFCFKDGQLTKYSYEPAVFAKSVGADLKPLQEKIDDCPICKTGLPTTLPPRKPSDSYQWTEELSAFLAKFITHLSDEYSVPPPHTVLGGCPPNPTGNSSCFDSGTQTIYIHPLDSGPQVSAHEFKHYLDDKEGKPYNETGAIAFAKAVVTKNFPTEPRIPTTLNRTGPFYGYSKWVQSMFEELNQYYDYVAKYLGVSGDIMNVAWTPEFIALGIEFAEDNFLANQRFIQLLVEIGITLGGIAAPLVSPALSKTDAAVLHNIASHMAMRALRKGLPAEFGIVSAQARDFGRAFASFDLGAIGAQFGSGAERIMQDINVAAATMMNQLKGFGLGGAGLGPVAAPRAGDIAGLGITAYAPFDIDVTAKRD